MTAFWWVGWEPILLYCLIHLGLVYNLGTTLLFHTLVFINWKPQIIPIDEHITASSDMTDDPDQSESVVAHIDGHHGDDDDDEENDAGEFMRDVGEVM